MAEYEPKEDLQVEEYETDEGSRYANLYQNTALRVVAAIIIIVLLVLGGRIIHHHLKKQDNTPTVTTTSSKITPTTNSTNGASGAGGSSNGSNSGSSNSSSNTPKPAQVPDTGPGDVVAVFLAVTFAAYLLHLGITSRKTN